MTTLGKRSRIEESTLLVAPKRPYVQHPPDKCVKKLPNDSYRVAWLCALPLEMAAAEAMLDEVHDHNVPNAPKDDNAYVLGRIGHHNVVIACLPNAGYGMNNAVAVAVNMNASFPKLQYRFMVGIGGGVPRKVDIRLGDVAVSNAVIQYDLGKTVQNGQFRRKSDPEKPPQNLLTAVSRLRSKHISTRTHIPDILGDLLQHNPQMRSYVNSSHLSDRLYQSEYDHDGHSESCDSCDVAQLVHRTPRDNSHPQIHYGTIGSASQVMKHGQSRDKLADELDIICCEMEAGGLMSNFPCLVVRGICDYADSHKNKAWQDYAAGVAAAYTKELLSVISSADGLKDSTSENLTTTPMQNDSTPEDREQVIMNALKFEHLDSRHAGIKSAHSKTCEWLLSHPCYTSWIDPTALQEHHGFLWIKGKPGAGKSTLMKYAFSKAKKGLVEDAVVISFFFNARGDTLEKSTLGMYRSLLVQLFENLPGLFKSLVGSDIPVKYLKGNLEWNIEDLSRLFSDAVDRLGQRPLICFIDALDECDVEQIRLMIEEFEALGQKALESGSQLYICLSSRHYPQVDIRCGQEVVLEEQSEHSKDLEKYVRSKLRAGSGKLINEVRTEILRKAAGVFLWAVLVVEILNDEFRKGRIFAVKERLQEIPRKLSELFKDILLKDSQNLDALLLCIQWILFSKRPLKREEFYFAIVYGLQPDSGTARWDREIITAEDMNRFVLSSSKGLAEVTRSKSGVVQFIHESVRDFLIKDNGIAELWPDLGSDFEINSHDQLKNCCHSYLLADDFGKRFTGYLSQGGQNLSVRRGIIGDTLPFLEYATSYVLHHADAAAVLVPQAAFLVAFNLPKWVAIHNLFVRGAINEHEPSVTIGYIAAVYDLPRIMASIDCYYNTESPGERYKTPLFAALANGNWKILSALLGLSSESLDKITKQTIGLIGPDFKLGKGDDALDWAVNMDVPELCRHLLPLQGGAQDIIKKALRLIPRALKLDHCSCVLALLHGFINCIARYKNGSEPLHATIRIGSLEMLSKLLPDGHDINVQDGEERTPLHFEVTNGDPQEVSLQWTVKADIEARDTGSDQEVVNLILAANADAEARCSEFERLHITPSCSGARGTGYNVADATRRAQYQLALPPGGNST